MKRRISPGSPGRVVMIADKANRTRYLHLGKGNFSLFRLFVNSRKRLFYAVFRHFALLNFLRFSAHFYNFGALKNIKIGAYYTYSSVP